MWREDFGRRNEETGERKSDCQGTEVIGTENGRHYFLVKLFFVFE